MNVADTQLLERLRAEFLEMPGMSLTMDQVIRLCGIERDACRRVLDALVDAKFLSRRHDGAYARWAEPEPRRMVTAGVGDYVPRVRRRAS